MALSAPPIKDMFSDVSDPKDRAERFEAYKSALPDKPFDARLIEARKDSAAVRFDGPGTNAGAEKMAEALAAIEKGVSPDVLTSIQTSLDELKGVQGDWNKEWTTTSPLSGSYSPTPPTGLVAFDLQAPAKYLVPRTTPLRNRTPRTTNGVGNIARFKAITGVTNSLTGGVASANSFFNSESTSTSFGSLSLLRPPTISYAASDVAVPFAEQGFSDFVSMRAQFQGQGYEDIRQLSHTALLWATMIGEERNLLFGRSSNTAGNTEGALSAPTSVAFGSAVTPNSGVTGNTANIANLFVYVCASSGYGLSVPSTVATSTALSATTNKTFNITWTDSAGALGYTVFLGTVTGIANAFFSGTTQTNTFQPSFTGGGTGGCPNSGAQPSASDGSASANAYDGFLSVLTDTAKAGTVSRLNTTFSTANPGTEFQTVFQNLYYNAGASGGSAPLADPNVIWIYPKGRVALSDLLKTASSANYRLTIDDTGTSGAHLGAIVTGILNEVTGTMVDFEVHPYMPNGCAIVHSETLPIPDSQVPSTVEVRNVIDYTAIEWPQTQMTWDTSTYILGAPLFYAPLWSGTVVGIAN